MAAFFGELARLARSWWRADRIRVSGRGSRLLRLREGAALRVGSTMAVVQARAVRPSRMIRAGDSGGDDAGLVVRYACLTATGPAELEVRPGGAAEPPELRWRAAGLERKVDDGDVHVYP